MSKRNQNVTKKKTFLEKIWSRKELLSIITVGIDVAYPITNFIYDFIYKAKCEMFYNIPNKYFASNINGRMLYLACIIILILICIIPWYIKKNDEENKILTKWMILPAGITGLYLGVINVYNLDEIIKQTQKTTDFFTDFNICLLENANITAMVVVLLGIATPIGLAIADKINGIKRKWIQQTITLFFVLSFVLSFVLMVYGTIFKLNINIEDKTKYETVNLKEKEYVVISEYNDKLLVAPLEDVDEDGKYEFITSNYNFIDLGEGIYKYIDFGDTPTIK